MKKIFLFFMLLFLLSPVYAVAEHGINGYISDSEDGTSANGAIVIFYIESRPWERLTDIVGSQGNSLQDNWYAIDLKNFETPWQDSEFLRIMVIKDECKTAITRVVLRDNVNEQQAPELELVDCGTPCPDCCICASLFGICWYSWSAIGIVLAIVVYYIIKKQILEKKKLYEKQSKSGGAVEGEGGTKIGEKPGKFRGKKKRTRKK